MGIAMAVDYKHHEAQKTELKPYGYSHSFPMLLFWSDRNFNWKYNRVWCLLHLERRRTAFFCHSVVTPFVKNSLVRDFCNYQWRCPHSSLDRPASSETWRSTRKGLGRHQWLATVCLLSSASWGCSCRRESQHTIMPSLLCTVLLHDF